MSHIQESSSAAARPSASRMITTTRYSGYSPKLHRRVNFMTRLEMLHWLLLEGTPEVDQLCEYYPEAQLESQRYAFDMWVRWQDGREECRTVVPSWSYAGAGPTSPGWGVLTAWGREHGYSCKLITEKKLAAHMRRINNWRRMLPFVRFAQDNPDEELEALVVSRLRSSGELPMREVLRLVPGRETYVTATVAKLLHSGALTADLEHHNFGGSLLLKPGA